MKMIIPIALGTIGLIACGYVIYKRRKHQFEISDDFDEKDIQRVNSLKVEKILEWVDRELSSHEYDGKRFVVNILPNKATLEIFKEKLSISKKDVNQCYLIYIEDKDSSETIVRKLVIAPEVSDELSCILQDRIFVIPVE